MLCRNSNEWGWGGVGVVVGALNSISPAGLLKKLFKKKKFFYVAV